MSGPRSSEGGGLNLVFPAVICVYDISGYISTFGVLRPSRIIAVSGDRLYLNFVRPPCVVWSGRLR